MIYFKLNLFFLLFSPVFGSSSNSSQSLSKKDIDIVERYLVASGIDVTDVNGPMAFFFAISNQTSPLRKFVTENNEAYNLNAVWNSKFTQHLT